MDGIIIGYDVTNRKSFEMVDDWYSFVEQNGKDKSTIIIVGAKCDEKERREVSFEEGRMYAKKKGIEFYEISSKNGINIDKTIERMIDLVVYQRIDEQPKSIRIQNEMQTTNEVIKIIEEYTKKHIGEIVFDTKENQWNQNQCELFEKIQKKSKILFLIDDGIHHIGCYVDSIINESGKYVDDKNCVLFSIERKELYPIKQSKYAICIHKIKEEKLLTIGKEDVVVFKEQKREQCYCKQSSFEYNKERIIGIEGRYSLFRLNRVVVLQME